MERNFSPWQLFLKSSLRGAPLILLVSRAERATPPCFTVIDVKGVRESDVLCVGPEIILFPPIFFLFFLLHCLSTVNLAY